MAASKPAPVLPWMRVPITIDAGSGVPLDAVPGLDSRLLAAMKQGKQPYRELFPVQSVVWTELAGGLSSAHDLCIAAPTGSGKTLAYLLPVVNGLARTSRGEPGVAHGLQALVVVPTRDLAQQVHEVLRQLCPAVGLTSGVAAAQQTLGAEAQSIMGRPISLGCAEATLNSSSSSTTMDAGHLQQQQEVDCACVDILVATPGRLMAHLQHTPGFSLRHLRYLVVDETDRLLRQSYQEWLPSVVSELSQPSHWSHAWQAAAAAAAPAATGAHPTATSHLLLPSSAGLQGLGSGAARMPFGVPRTVKLIVSATLTRDPSKLQRLDLHCPRYVATSAADHRYHLPRSLQEFKVLCSAARKPLTLLGLLQELRGQPTVVFASSLDTTHKLYLLLQAALEGAQAGGSNEVAEFASHLTSAQRAAALRRFRTGEIKVLVASDAMTRGMDVEGVENVVNYDAPVYAKTYVHRAGRTARAGRSGRVYTLLRDEDVRHFKQMLRKADNTFVRTHRLAPGAADALKPALDAALQQVAELLSAEAADDAARGASTLGSQAGQGKGKPAGRARGTEGSKQHAEVEGDVAGTGGKGAPLQQQQQMQGGKAKRPQQPADQGPKGKRVKQGAGAH